MILRVPLAYLGVAAACILLHNVVIITADRGGSPLWLSILLSFGFVASAGYVLHSLFTFRRPLAVAGFVRYAFAMSANIPLAFITTWLWHEQVSLPMPLAAPIASLCMLAVNFTLGSWAISRPQWKKAAVRS